MQIRKCEKLKMQKERRKHRSYKNASTTQGMKINISRYVCMAREPTPMLNMLRIRGVRQDGMNGGEKWLQQRLQP